jgi:CPA1 family monovalent cation:H+ antiporter
LLENTIGLLTAYAAYVPAERAGVSAVLAAVTVGCYVGWRAPEIASPTTRLQGFGMWELLQFLLNALLFVLIGLEAIVIRYSPTLAAAAALAIAVTLLARALSVGLPTALWRERLGLPPGAATVLTWGGLRGGISVALALALPAGPERDPVVALTYAVVVFSILVQGLSMGRVVRRVQAA